MFFIFPMEDRYSFWMAKTLIPLDIIWISENMEIAYILENVQPCTEEKIYKCPSFTPDKPGKYVLEVNAGWVEKNNIETGNKVELKK
mgnify:CR=1 FL=1